MPQPLRTLIMVPNVNPQPDARGMGVGGAERMALQLCRHFDRQRVQPLLLVFRDPGAAAEDLKQSGVPCFVLPKHGKLPLAFWLALRKLIRRERIDVVLSMLQGTNSHNLIVTPTVPGVGCLISYRSQQAAVQFRQTEGRLAARADYLITLNASSAESLAQYYRLPRERIVVIPNGADAEALPFVAYEQRQALRLALGLPEDAFIMYSCSRIAAVKGQDVLARALLELGPLLIERKVLWVNSGAVQDSALRQQIESTLAAYPAHFRLLPHVDNPHQLLSAADCVAVPSRSESFGLSMLEAAFVGRPVLSSSVGVAPDLLAAGRGWLAEPGSVEALVSSLKLVLSQEPGQLAEAGRRLHDYAVEHYSIAASAAAYADIIEAAVRRRRGGGLLADAGGRFAL